MQTHQMTIQSSAQNRLRLINAPHQVLPEDYTPSAQTTLSDIIAIDDPRWLFAARVQISLNGSNRTPTQGQFDDLLDIAQHAGFSDMHARAIVGIVEEAQRRGGLDVIAMNALMRIPTPASDTDPELSQRARWITFGALFAWSLMIAGLMQFV